MPSSSVQVGEVGRVGLVQVVVAFGYWGTGGCDGGAEEGGEVFAGGEAGELGCEGVGGEEVVEDGVPYTDL